VLRKILDFFVFSSLYVALCAVLLIWQTSRLLLGISPPDKLIGFVFFSTICSYNFHWYLTRYSVNPSRRIQWTHHHRVLHFILYLVGGVGAAVYFFYLTPFIIALLPGILLTFLYSAPKLPQKIFRRLRRLAIGKTFYLAFVWVYVTTVLPIVIAGARWHPSFILFTASRFSFIYACCLIFDYRDREDDRAGGIVSMITLLNEKGIDRLFYGSMTLFFLTSAALSHYHYPAFYILLLLIPGAVVTAIYREAKRNFSDYLYYVLLDGMVMFSSLLMLIFRI
jgi:4-hydroxybenzoate polyprenyltransferase